MLGFRHRRRARSGSNAARVTMRRELCSPPSTTRLRARRSWPSACCSPRWAAIATARSRPAPVPEARHRGPAACRRPFRPAALAPRRRAELHPLHPQRAWQAGSQHCRETSRPRNRGDGEAAARRGGERWSQHARCSECGRWRWHRQARRAHRPAATPRRWRELRDGSSRHPSSSGPLRRSALRRAIRRVPWSTAPCRRFRRGAGPGSCRRWREPEPARPRFRPTRAQHTIALGPRSLAPGQAATDGFRGEALAGRS